MLSCCNTLFKGSFSYIFLNSEYTYKSIQFGICPHCGALKFREYRQDYNGKEYVKDLTGKEAQTKLNQWKRRLNFQHQGTKGNQNIFYGDFKKSSRKDRNNNPIYLQLRKNFNNQTEIIGEIETKISYI